MNNKGQTLIIFVILIPIFFILLSLIIDLGYLYIEKRNINNNLYDAVEYYLDNLDNENVKENTKKLLEKNIDNIDTIFNDTDEYIEIKVEKKRKNYNIINLNNNIEIIYKGFKIDKKIIKG